MGFFSELEGNLEKLIEGFFRDRFRGGLQPAEVAKMLAREMRNQCRAGLNEIFVPNRFEIYLGGDDYKAIKPVADRLSSEMCQFVAGKADVERYTLLGPVEVTILEGDDIGPGQSRIMSFFDEPDALTGLQETSVPEETLRYAPVKTGPAPEPVERTEKQAELVVTEGVYLGRKFMLGGDLAIIGRKETSDVCLPDDSVSRRQAVIIKAGCRYIIKDQSSTNGTFVNGTRVTQTELVSGDMIKIGRNVLVFKVE